MVGYLLAGVIIGPFVLNVAGSAADVMHVAEFGVVMMLFVVGLATALAVGRLIKSQLFETSAYNPVLLSGTLAILALAALLACLFPARRATLVNPVEALRSE